MNKIIDHNADYSTISYTISGPPTTTIVWHLETNNTDPDRNFTLIERLTIAAEIEKIINTEEGAKLLVPPIGSNSAYRIVKNDVSVAAKGSGVLGLSESAFDGTESSYIDEKGFMRPASLARTLAHELSHLALDTNDPLVDGSDIDEKPEYIEFLKRPDTEVLGNAVEFENKVMAELENTTDPFVRTHYLGHVLRPDLSELISRLNIDDYLSETEKIERTKFGLLTEPSEGVDIYLGSDDDKTDLLVGVNGDDTIIAGGGKNFIFGADGADRLYGGKQKDFLVGGTGIDRLSGGTKNSVLAQLIIDGGIDHETVFYDDEEQDLLEGGTGSDTYYVHAAEHTLDAETADPMAYFDFIEGWNINRQERNGIAFDDTLQRWDTVDRVSDVDRAGEIRIQDNLAFSLQLNGIAWNFERISYQGVDFFADEEQKNAVFVNDGDLFVMRSYRQAEFGDQIDAYWSGYVATVIIEDFNSGDFNFTIPTGDQGTNGNDTPTLTPGGPGDGAYYHGLDGDDVIIGTVEGDALRGDAGNDQISGGDGDDDVSGGDGNDVVSGEDGNDFVSGGAGDDTISGGAGDDWIRGGAGRDTISGGAGNDTIYFDNGDYFWTTGVPINIGGTGIDTLIIEAGSSFNTAGLSWYGFERFQGADGNDRVDGNDDSIDYWFDGGAGNDLLTGNAGNDTLLGGDGDDILRGGAGQDEYSGGAGNDTIYYGGGDLFWDGGSPKDIGGTGIDTLIMEAGARFNTGGLSWYGFERFEGAEKDDRVDGNDASVDYWLDGGAGNDSLKGHGGADTLIGGTGDDGLTGGAGSDTFVFRFGETGHDTISDFSAGAATDDIIEFSSSVFSSLSEVLAAAADDGTSSTITIDANTSIVLTNVLVADLHQDDFNFA